MSIVVRRLRMSARRRAGAGLSDQTDPRHHGDQRRRHQRRLHARDRRGVSRSATASRIIVENRPGGDMNIGGRACADAAPRRLHRSAILPIETLAYNQFLFKKIPYDPEKDFEPITNPFFNTQVLVVERGAEREDARRARRLSEGEARHPELHGAVGAARAVHGEVEAEDRRRSGAGAVQGRRRGGQRHALRHDAGRVLRHRQLDGAYPRRRPCGRSRSTAMRARRSFPDVPTLARARLPRGDDAGLFRPRRARRHAQADHRQAVRADRDRSAATPSSARSA